MRRREFLRNGLAAAAGAVAAPLLNLGRCRLLADDRLPAVSTRAIDIVAETTVIDMLGLLTLDWPRLYEWQADGSTFGEADFLRLRASGVDVLHPAVDPQQADPWQAAHAWLAGWNRLLAQRPEYFVRVERFADLHRARAEGRIGLLLGFQSSDHFRTAADVAAFHALGQRVSQLTYDGPNRLGGGCREPVDHGLSSFGAEVVAAMNDCGMAVDLSHCGERTTLDAIAASRGPVLVTHANCAALVPGHPRTKSDEVLRALAAAGGVMGITFLPAFVRARGAARLDDVLDHFDHVARRVGVEHVGLGSDFDVDARDPRTGRVRPRYELAGLEPAHRVFALAEGLLRRGWNASDISLALGGNFARALGAIWGDGPDGGGWTVLAAAGSA